MTATRRRARDGRRPPGGDDAGRLAPRERRGPVGVARLDLVPALVGRPRGGVRVGPVRRRAVGHVVPGVRRAVGRRGDHRVGAELPEAAGVRVDADALDVALLIRWPVLADLPVRAAAARPGGVRAAEAVAELVRGRRERARRRAERRRGVAAVDDRGRRLVAVVGRHHVVVRDAEVDRGHADGVERALVVVGVVEPLRHASHRVRALVAARLAGVLDVQDVDPPLVGDAHAERHRQHRLRLAEHRPGIERHRAVGRARERRAARRQRDGHDLERLHVVERHADDREAVVRGAPGALERARVGVVGEGRDAEVDAAVRPGRGGAVPSRRPRPCRPAA